VFMAWAYRRRGRGSIAACCASATICSRVSFPRPSGRGSIAATSSPSFMVMACALPPAIRPGLHCGDGPPGTPATDHTTSPGHQAGAPLRLEVADLAGVVAVSFPRPSGRGSIAAVRRGVLLISSAVTFPRPSGRGSIAAPRRTARTASTAASPGHQAGAPLRRRRRGRLHAGG